MIANKLKKLKEQFKNYHIDGYVVPKNDEFFSEFSNKDRLNFITGFSGSAGLAVILKNKNYLFLRQSMNFFPSSFLVVHL